MKRKLLTTTLLSMSLLSLNLSAAVGVDKCAGGFCMVDLSKKSSTVEKEEVQENKDGYKTILVDNIETIVFSHSKYVMTQLEVVEYDLEQMKNNLLVPVLNLDLPLSDYLCADNLKPVKIVGIANTYECSYHFF